MSAPGFSITDGKGFHMTFANGWTVSVQFGYGNYCSNRDWKGSDPSNPMARFREAPPHSPTAEIAAWDSANRWHDFGADQVEGWQTPEAVLAFMNKIAALPA